MSFDYSTVDLEALLQRAYSQMTELQRPGVAKARASGRVIFAVHMGVGKTFMGLTSGLCFKPQFWLLIGSKGAIAAWESQSREWFPEIFNQPNTFTIVRGQAHERKAAYQTNSLIYATTPAAFIRDIVWLSTKKVKFDVVSIDEIHKAGLRNRKSQATKAVIQLIKLVEKHLGRQVKLINPMTGTWTRKGPPGMFAVLHILAPKIFRDYWPFINTFCIVFKGAFGSEILGPKNTEGLAIMTQPYVYQVSKEDVKQYLPPIHRIFLTSKLPKDIRHHYNTLAEHMYLELSEGSVSSVTTILSAYLKLRQLITCPAIIDPSWGVGPALELVVDKIQENDELPNWKHNIIFTPFLAALPYYRDHLMEVLNFKAEEILIVKGGMSIEEIQAVEATFRKNPDTMILASLKMSQAWNAETALNVYFPHFDWDQDENSQAESRSSRTNGTQEYINSYYINFENTITEDMREVLNTNTHMTNVTFQDFKRIADQSRQKWLARNQPQQ